LNREGHKGREVCTNRVRQQEPKTLPPAIRTKGVMLKHPNTGAAGCSDISEGFSLENVALAVQLVFRHGFHG